MYSSPLETGYKTGRFPGVLGRKNPLSVVLFKPDYLTSEQLALIDHHDLFIMIITENTIE